MPPQIPEDQASNVSKEDVEDVVSEEGSEEEQAGTKKKGNGKKQDDDDDDDDDVEEGDGADVYAVDAITDHNFTEDGVLHFQVKWEGYEKKSDRTWETEDNLESAQAIVDEYLEQFGGREALVAAWEEKLAAANAKKNKKRARATSETSAPPKRGRKNGVAISSSVTSATEKKREFKPPSGSWEDDVVNIDAAEGDNQEIVVFLTWKSGDKTQHPKQAVYKRCPQKMLQFYEKHLVFKKSDDVPDAAAEA